VSMQPTPPDEQTPERAVFTQSVAELEGRFERLYTSLELIVKAITSYAQATQHGQQASTSVIGLANYFKKLWKALELTVNALSSYAEVAHYSEQQFNQLADVAREGIELVQAVVSGDDITPQWLAQRDALVAQLLRLIDDDGMLADQTEEETTPP
jgi:hypothetical protein